MEHDGVPDSVREYPVADVVSNNGSTVVRLAGELDLYNADAVRDALEAAIAAAPDRLVVDLSAVRFMDSTMLGVLIEARAKLRDRGAFLLAEPQLETRRALQVSGLDRHFSVHDTLADALESQL